MPLVTSAVNSSDEGDHHRHMVAAEVSHFLGLILIFEGFPHSAFPIFRHTSLKWGFYFYRDTSRILESDSIT